MPVVGRAVLRPVLGGFTCYRLLAGWTELLAVVAKDRVATVAAVGVGHRRALQEQFAHLLGGLAPILLGLELLAEFLAFGFLVEVAHTCPNVTGLKTVYGSR